MTRHSIAEIGSARKRTGPNSLSEMSRQLDETLYILRDKLVKGEAGGFRWKAEIGAHLGQQNKSPLRAEWAI